MRHQFGPWLSAIFAAVLSLIILSANLIGRFTSGATDTADLVFYCFLPMCFVFVGISLSDLRAENRRLREQLAELAARSSSHQQNVDLAS